MIIDLFILMAAFYLSIPFVAGYTAKSYGRPFWSWFIFACFFPAIAHLILYFSIKSDIKKNKLASLLSEGEITYMDNQIHQVLDEHQIPKKPVIIKKAKQDPN